MQAPFIQFNSGLILVVFPKDTPHTKFPELHFCYCLKIVLPMFLNISVRCQAMDEKTSIFTSSSRLSMKVFKAFL